MTISNTAPGTSFSAEQLVRALGAFIDRAVAANGGSTAARMPSHRVKFCWPPHPISYSYHVLATDWKHSGTFEAHGETFEVKIAKTPFGVFGRCPAIWHEERGETVDEMLDNLRTTSEPFFARGLAINRTLEAPGRFQGSIADLGPLDLLKLLYCEDRDVANEARTAIEVRANNEAIFPAFIEILGDRRHPNRRSAQWCVLDIFEVLPSFCDRPSDEQAAIEAMKGLIWDAEDDFARTIYKAGVVLGGHLPYAHGGPALIECLAAPSRIGRRAAIHGLFHVVEWMPDMRSRVVAALRRAADSDPEPMLRNYAAQIAEDILCGDGDHAPEPFFPGEL
jgi:hypothetical protein